MDHYSWMAELATLADR